MSLAEQITADVESVFLVVDDFAESVTRYPLGVVGDAETTVAVFVEGDPNREVAFGEQVVRVGTLHLSSEVSVDTRDAWLVRGQTWQTLTVESVELGYLVVRIQRNDKTNTRRVEGARLL